MHAALRDMLLNYFCNNIVEAIQMTLDSTTNNASNITLKNSASNEINACLEALIEESAKTDCAYIICDALVKAFSFGR